MLEAAARRAVEAWAEAVDGADDALERAATPEAAHALLYPRGESTRLVVRGPRLQALRIAALDAGSRPTFTVEAELSGRRYLEDRDTAAVLEGSKDRATTFTERWTLALGDDPATPWRIVATAAGGLAPCCSPSPTSPRAATARRSTPSAPPSSPAARACSTSTATRTTTAACSRSPASRAGCTRRCWRARARRSSGST